MREEPARPSRPCRHAVRARPVRHGAPDQAQDSDARPVEACRRARSVRAAVRLLEPATRTQLSRPGCSRRGQAIPLAPGGRAATGAALAALASILLQPRPAQALPEARADRRTDG